MIYLNCGTHGDTWEHLLGASDWEHYGGHSRSGDVVIRWGANNEQHAGTYGSGVRVLNPNIILDKYEQLKKMHAGGVLVPKFWRDRGGWATAGEPHDVVVKRMASIRGYGIRRMSANGMIMSDGSMKLQDSSGRDLYYQEFIDKEREFRVMVVGEAIAFVMEKTPPDDGRITWNEHQGSEWIAIADWDEEDGLRRALKTAAYCATKAIGYDFGAVDIMKKGRNYYVLEVNSKPQLGPRNSEHFINAISSYLDLIPTTRVGPTPRPTPRPTPAPTPGHATSWGFCPYCTHALEAGHEGWRACPYCGHSF